MEPVRIVMTVAGSDPSGGAGIQADLKVFQAMGVYGLSVASVLTSQNSEGVVNISGVSPDFFSSQMHVILNDMTPSALKTGMLYSAENVGILAETIKQRSLKNLVIDPVFISSTGVLLGQEGMPEALKDLLFPLAKVITPNTYEASVLTGLKIENEDDMKKAAIALTEFGPGSVIITGGHLKEKAIDVLFDGEEFLSVENDLLDGRFHGTGCVYSAAVTASLALGFGVKEAFLKAKDFTYHAMKSSVSVGRGMKMLKI